MLHLFKQWLTIAKFALIVQTNTSFGQLYIRFNKRRNVYLIFRLNGKTAIWTIVSFWVSPPDYTNWEFMFVMQKPRVQ